MKLDEYLNDTIKELGMPVEASQVTKLMIGDLEIEKGDLQSFDIDIDKETQSITIGDRTFTEAPINITIITQDKQISLNPVTGTFSEELEIRTVPMLEIGHVIKRQLELIKANLSLPSTGTRDAKEHGIIDLANGLSRMVKAQSSTGAKKSKREFKAIDYLHKATSTILGEETINKERTTDDCIRMLAPYKDTLTGCLALLPAREVVVSIKKGKEDHKQEVIQLFQSLCANFATVQASPSQEVAGDALYDTTPPMALTGRSNAASVGGYTYEARANQTTTAANVPMYAVGGTAGIGAEGGDSTYAEIEVDVANSDMAGGGSQPPFDAVYEASGRPVDPATAWAQREAEGVVYADPEFDAFKVAIEAYVETLVAAERTSYHFDFDHTQTKRHYHKTERQGGELSNLYPAGISYKKVEEAYATYMEKRTGPGEDLVGRSIIANPAYLKFFVGELKRNNISTHVTTYGNALVAKQALLDNGIRVHSLAGYGAATHMPGIHVVSGDSTDNPPQYFRSKVIDQTTGVIQFSPDTTAEIAKQKIVEITARTKAPSARKEQLTQETLANLTAARNIVNPDLSQQYEYIYIGGDKRDMMELQLQVSGLQQGGVAVLCDDSKHDSVQNSPKDSTFITEQLELGENAHIGTKTFTALVELQTERLRLMLKMLKEQVELPAKLGDLVQKSAEATRDLSLNQSAVAQLGASNAELEAEKTEVERAIQGILPSWDSEVRGATKTGNLRFVQNAQGNVTHYLIASQSNPTKTKLFVLNPPITAQKAEDIETADELTLLGRGQVVNYKIGGSSKELSAHQEPELLDVAFNDIDTHLGELKGQLAAIQGNIRLHGEQNAKLLESQLRIQHTLNEEILPQQAAVEAEIEELQAGIAEHKAAITSIEAVVEAERAEEKEKADAEQAREAAIAPRPRASTAVAATGGEADYMNGPEAIALMASGGNDDYINGPRARAMMASGGAPARPRANTAGAGGGFSRQRHSTTSRAPTLPRKRREEGGERMPSASPGDPYAQGTGAQGLTKDSRA